MKISGFTFVKDATKYDLPIVESIRSILPIVDEYIVNVGKSNDKTLSMVKNIKSKKIKIIQNNWDARYTEKMRIYAVQTNLAMYQCTGDWLFYLQADEVVHEKDLDSIYKSMENNFEDKKIQGLLFDWHHFWGSYDYYLDTYVHYQREIRIIRNFLGITSWKDAQGFRLDGKKLKVKHSNGHIYHYGWVVPPAKARAKSYNHSLYYRGEKATEKFFIPEEQEFYYNVNPYFLSKFKSTHPAVMRSKIKKTKSEFNIKLCRPKIKRKMFKRNIQTFLYRTLGLRLGEYRNYNLIGK